MGVERVVVVESFEDVVSVAVAGQQDRLAVFLGEKHERGEVWCGDLVADTELFGQGESSAPRRSAAWSSGPSARSTSERSALDVVASLAGSRLTFSWFALSQSFHSFRNLVRGPRRTVR